MLFSSWRKLVVGSATVTSTFPWNKTSYALQQENNILSSGSSSSSSSSDKKLLHIVVIHRHGDRAPVTKSIGPKYPHTIEVENEWRTRIVSGRNEEILKEVAKAQCSQGNDSIYTGRDVAGAPYGQLTDKGSDQLMALGRSLRQIYATENNFLPADLNGEHIFTRSTNICRTMNSVRSLLVGLYGMNSAAEVASRCAEDQTNGVTTFPQIRSFPAGQDPMIDGPCPDPALKDEIRKKIIEQHAIPDGYPHGYDALNEKMQRHLGFEKRVNWLQAREQLVCMQSHGLPFPDGLDETDVGKLYDIELWIVKKLFGDRTYNALAIGAFYLELRDRLKDIQADAAPELLSIYSAHDYTLIPFLEGLRILPESFPHYAAYVVMEIAAGENPADKFIRFLYNGDEVLFPGCESGWMELQYVVDLLHACGTGAPEPPALVPLSVSVTESSPASESTPATAPVHETSQLIGDRPAVDAPAAVADHTVTPTDNQATAAAAKI